MSSTILSRTISGLPDKRIVLSGSHFSRAFDFGANWTKLRIALRATITDSGGNLTGTPRLALGVCAGNSNFFNDASVTNFCGIVSNNATLIRFTSPLRYTGIISRAVKQVGSTITFGSTDISAAGTVLFDATAADRQFLIVDITKGSPNYTFNAFGNNTGFLGGDVDSATFIAQADAVTPVFANCAFGTDVTLAVDESAGRFDHVNISWDQTASNVEISDLRLIRFS